MNHLKILKESFRLVLKHKYLWLLGLLLGTGSGINFYNLGNGNSDFFKQNGSDQNIASIVSANVRDAGQVLGDKISANMSNTEWALIATFIIILIIVLVYLSVTAKGATTWAIAKLHSDAKYSLSDAWNAGQKYFWRRLSYGIIVCASVLVIVTVLAIPIIILSIFELIIPAIILGILFGLAFVVFVVYLSLFLPYAERILFLENKKTFPAIIAGFNLFNKNWINLILMYLILFAIGIGVAIGLIIALVISGLLVFGVGALFYAVNHVAGYAVGGLIGLIVLIALIVFSGALQSFNWAVITLTYKEIKGQ